MLAPSIFHLKVPKGNDKGPIAAESVFSGIAEIFREKPAPLSFEIVVQNGFLYFLVVCESAHRDLVRGQIFAHYPNIETEDVNDYTTSLSLNSVVGELKLERPDVYPIKTYKELESDFLASFSGMATSLSKDAILAMQLVVEPINKEVFSYKFKKLFKDYWVETNRKNSSMREQLEESEYKKLEKPLFHTSIRCIASASSKADLLITSVVSLFKILDNPNLNSFKLNRKGSGKLLEQFRSRTISSKKIILNSAELATLYHLPTQSAPIAQVSSTSSKRSEPPINLPTKSSTVIPFALTSFRGAETEFGIKREDRRRHLYIIGKTGVGKSKLIELLALADIRQGKGCVVMDPHGDLAEELLRYIPRDRLYDIVYFNPGDIEYPMSFNPLEGSGSLEFRQNTVTGFISIFKKLFSFTWNQRLEHVLRFTTLALLDVPGATVLAIPKMLSDTQFRQSVIALIQDPLVKKFWTTEFSSWNDQYAGEAITPLINKVGQFVASPLIRNIVGQSRSTVNLEEIMNGEKILIANFAIGKLGEENSALLGAMFITKLWQAAVARSSMPEIERKDTYLYVDEFQNFATSAFANILSEARKYKLNLTVAHQYMAQLPQEVRSTIFGNVGSIISFRIGGEDAAILEKEYTPTFSSEDFMRLDMRHFYAKMTIDGQTAVPFSGKTIDFPNPDEDFKNDVIKISRERYARPRDQVEKEVAEFENEGFTQGKIQIQEAPKFSEPLI